LLFVSCIAGAQVKISGTVMDTHGKRVTGASVYLDNTIDGATTDSMGTFSFTTTEKGNQTLVATEKDHQTMGIPLVLVHDTSGIVMTMAMSTMRNLDAVTITAGSFASSDRTKTVLNPIDIVTTAGSNGDIVQAMEKMPGTQQTGTDNGLFVRGGDASEAAILVDGVVVQNAFFSGGPGVATRSRFNPFQYQGVSFSSGGYSARYGQALSGLLELTSTDMPDKSNMNVGINFAGVYASGTKKWKKSALDVGGSYNNLAPFYGIASTNFNFYKVPVGANGNARYIWTPDKTSMFKANFAVNYNESGVRIPNPYAGLPDSLNTFHIYDDSIDFVTKDLNYFSNVSYKKTWKNKYVLYTAASYSLDRTNNSFNGYPLKADEHRAQYRIEGKEFVTSALTAIVGGEVQSFGVDKHTGQDSFAYAQNFIETQLAGFAEAEWTPFYWLSVKPGLRFEHSALLNKNDIAPRFSMAIRTGNHSQISLATGIFYQDPAYLYLEAKTDPAHPTHILGDSLNLQSAVHYIANWQWSKSDRTFRVEAYYKSYQNLVREYDSVYDPNKYRSIYGNVPINNSGYGYAQGLELFWWDKKSVKNGQYWITYSYVDTRRLYSNFPPYTGTPFLSTPTFIAKNTLNVVAKYFVDKIHTNFSATYSYSSGFPYFNPLNSDPLSKSQFLSQTTPSINNTSLMVAYLHSFGRWFSVFYLSVDNVLNTHNVYGYRYAYDAKGQAIAGSQTPIVPALYRTVFLGANFSLTQFSKDEL